MAAALADPDPDVVVVRFDRHRRAFRELSCFERQQLLESPNIASVEIGKDGFTAGARRVFRIIREYPAISRDTDRHFADLLTQNRRRGFAYAGTKFLFRAYRTYRKLLAQPRVVWSAVKTKRIDPETGIVLLSNPIVLGKFLPRVLHVTRKCAFICHDLIPILRPEFAIDSDHAQRFSRNIVRAIRAKTDILCTSKTSMAMLVGNLDALEGTRVHRFPMPSILHEKAKAAGRTDRLGAAEPFVLYCSTIEARKNHLLLAKVWQRAADEGVSLPKLVCVGKWGWGANELIDYLAAHPALSSRIIFAGPVGDLELVDYYRGALFGVVPSRMEGWGYGASECLDFGIPVIVSTAPALRESTRGIMPAIDPDDTAGWYAEIRRMSEDSAYRCALSRRIAEVHAPTPTAASWNGIKHALVGSTSPA